MVTQDTHGSETLLARKFKRNGEHFVVAVSEDEKDATVTDEKGTIVTIRFGSGHLRVRLPNGWGYSESSMEKAVERAAKLCVESRGQLTPEEAYKEMVDYVKQDPD